MLSEERARAIWKRAAQLQAEAAHRLEERSRALVTRGEAKEASHGFRVRDVEAAAVEAGISKEFVHLALSEVAESETRAKPLPAWADGAATRLLGTSQRSLEISRDLQAAPAEVFEAMQRLLPAHPYFLALRDTVGQNLLDGAILAFEVPSVWSSPYTDFRTEMAWADMRELHFVLRPLSQSEIVATQVRITVDLTWSRKLNWWVGAGTSGLFAAGGGAAGGAIAAGMFGLGALIALPIAAAGAAAGAGITGLGYGGLYRWGVKRGVRAIEKLLRALEVHARTRGAFTTATTLPRGGGDAEGAAAGQPPLRS
jgi:hypothetical protein